MQLIVACLSTGCPQPLVYLSYSPIQLLLKPGSCACYELQEELVLPSEMWTVHSHLQPGAVDRLSPRLSQRVQLAHTACSSVYTALLDEKTPVVVKVRWKGNGSDSTCLFPLSVGGCSASEASA